jgi:hypothetical protein
LAKSFFSSKKTAVLNVLPANKIGSIIFKASISSAEKRNTYNNSKNFVEVIDQKTKIALVTAINHPELL